MTLRQRLSSNLWQMMAGAILIAVSVAALASTPGESIMDEDILYAPDFTLTTLEGEKVTLSKLRGQVVLINFWATWCAPCRYEIPDLSRIYTQYKDDGLEILGVSMDEIESHYLEKFQQNYKMTYPILHGSPAELARLSNLYGGIYSIPTTFIIDREGIIRDIFVGARREADFLAAIKQLL